MPLSKLLPMDVAARVVDAATSVPLLTDAPFESTGVLERGIHLHWAVPDALATAVVRDQQRPRFRGVPDLWLVVRFNPVVADEPRTHRAWVVDSITETVSPLAGWEPPTDRTAARIHTAVGTLDRVASGLGEWPAGDETFDQLDAAYYPACRTRLGFHDDLADIAAATGKVSYSVIGWYSLPSFDPFYNTRVGLRDRLGTRDDLRVNRHLATTVSTAEVALDWAPAMKVQAVAEASKAERFTLQSSVDSATETIKARSDQLRELVEALDFEPSSPEHAIVDSIVPGSAHTHTVCHGSVMEVPLRESKLIALGKLETDKVGVYPNLMRAMAEVASGTEEVEDADWLEMMLGQLGEQSGTAAGVIDLPGAQHARTFQSVPGTSTFYARLEIHPQPLGRHDRLELADLSAGSQMMAMGHWPNMTTRSAQVDHARASMQRAIPPTLQRLPAAQPQGPSEVEVIAWISDLRAAFAAARQAAAAAGTPLDPRLIRVQDHRPVATPTTQGRSAPSMGPDQAGWWLDLGPEDAPIDLAGNPLHQQLAELRYGVGGASVHMPDPANLFEVPGPRWYRPWAPHVVLFGAKRSYRHGMDGRFSADGNLFTRFSSEAITGMRVGGATVHGRDLMAKPTELNAIGLPGVVGELVAEHLLADADNGPVMAAHATRSGDAQMPDAKQMTAASRSTWLSRGTFVEAAQHGAFAAVDLIGTAPSPVAQQPWRDWYGPLFLDTATTHRRKRFNDAWQLPTESIDAVDRDPAVMWDQQRQFAERQVATVTIAKVLKKNLVTELTLDPQGRPVPRQPPPDGVSADSFDKIDVVSASITQLDDALFAAGEREQGGFLHVDRVRVVDTFGASAEWTAPTDVLPLDPLPSFATSLQPRLTSWGRLGFRLQAAGDGTAEATPLTPPICGVLLPDFVDQSLELYDADGSPIGQLAADDPFAGDAGTPRTLTTTLTLLPWVAALLPPGAPPTSAIANLTLRRFVEALLAQTLDVPAGDLGWHETGFTAMLRVFDTLRSTLDPAAVSTDKKVRLLGEPIVLMNVRLLFEASTSAPADLKRQPQVVPGDGLPVLRVRVGDVTRPDDGVLGCFKIGATPADDRFAPPSPEAAAKAVLNQMVFRSSAQKEQAVTHPFIAGQVSEFDVAANTPVDTVVIADTRGSLFATCGMLPRKTVTIPRDFIEPALRALRPTFRVGPLLAFDRQGALVPLLPQPEIEGTDAEFVRNDGTTYPTVAVPPSLPLADLPPQRVRLTDGWARIVPAT